MQVHGQSRSKGIVLSYCVTVIRALAQFLLTSLYVKSMGLTDYGFYQYIYSIASYAIILDFGISSVVNKNVVEKISAGDRNGVENVLYYCAMLTIVIVFISLLCTSVIICNIMNTTMPCI